jgi:hypothetical protein
MRSFPSRLANKELKLSICPEMEVVNIMISKHDLNRGESTEAIIFWSFNGKVLIHISMSKPPVLVQNIDKFEANH